MQIQKQNNIKVWLKAVRMFSFTASIVPVLIGGAVSLHSTGQTGWYLFPLILICSVLLHAGTNIISDYYDHVNGVDKDYTYGSSRVIVDGLLPARSLFKAGIILFVAASFLGIALIAVRGVTVLVLGAIGLMGGFFYTAKPIGYKYIALGDLLVFILMGPLMVIGSDFVLTGHFHKMALMASLPIGFLVVAILHANNLRDITHDVDAGIKTLANILGHNGAMIEYYLLLSASYVSVFIMVLLKILPVWSLFVFLSIPLAVMQMGLVHKTGPADTGFIADLDSRTAQLHLVFGVLLIAGITIGAFV